MSLSKDYIKKFVEEDHKGELIVITTDNEHKYYHNAYKNPPIVWDWDNETFYALESNEEITDGNNPMQLTAVALNDIQFLTVKLDKAGSLKFINENITDENAKKQAKALLQKLSHSTMKPRTLSGDNLGDF